MQDLNDQIFKHLFSIAKSSNDKEGVVCAALVDNKGNILLSTYSYADGRHAEYELLEQIEKLHIAISSSMTLYVTLEPCSKRTNIHFINKDCASLIAKSGIKHVVFAAIDPQYGKDTSYIFQKAGITYRQTSSKEIIKEAKDLFNNTNKNDYRI